MRNIARLSLALTFATGAAVAPACGDYDDRVAPNDGPTKPTPDSTATSGDGDAVVTGLTTWHKDVKPLVMRHCIGCHVEGGIGTMSLETYEATEPWRAAMVARVNDPDPRDRMPPWPMDPTCRDVIDARVLTPLEKAVFTDWKGDAYAEGDPSTYVAPELPQAPDLGAPQVTLERADAYTPRIVTSDDYRCFLFPATVAAETWVRAVDIVPDEKEVVHHALLFVVPSSEVARLEALDGADGKPGYDCVGGSGADGEALLAGWVPGMLPIVFPPGTAFRVPAGSRYVMQMHYNTDNVKDTPPIPADTTSARLWTRGRQGLTDEVRIRGVFDAQLDIGPGEDPAVEGVTLRSPFSETVIGVIPHMHLLGASIDVTTKALGGSTPVCLAKIPQWDFHWQQTYQYADDDHVPVRLGDEITIGCTYDNSQGTETIHWGEGTADEMCLAYLVTKTPLYDDAADTLCNGFTNCMKDCPTADSLCPLDCMMWSEGGAECAACALTPVYAECAVGEGGGCGALLLGLGGCYNTCVEGKGANATTLDKISCAIVDCKSELDSFYGGCLEALLRAGKCNDEAEACGIGDPYAQ